MKIQKISIKNQNYNLKIVENEQDLRGNPLAIELLNRLATESEIDLAKKLWSQGIALETLHAPEELWQINEKWISEAFSGGAGRMLFILEDNNKPIHATIITVNDPEARKKNKVDESVGTYIYVTHAVTEEIYKGKGLFSGMLDKITTMMLNPKREVKQPIHYSISVSNAPAVRLSDNEELNYIMNLPTYTGMWQKRFENNKLQVRFQDLKTGAQEGRERLPIDGFLNNKKLDESLVDKLIKEKKPEAKEEGKFVRGLFEEGKDSRSYAEAVSARKGALLVKLIKGISPITNQPFDQKDANNYGWMESENDLFEKYKHCDAFDYADLVKDFKEFKKQNPELMPKPAWEQQADIFKAIKQMNLTKNLTKNSVEEVRVKGISPITGEPFNEKDFELFGNIKNEKQLIETWKEFKEFKDFPNFLEVFREFKRCNPDIPSTKVSGAKVKVVENINLGKSKL